MPESFTPKIGDPAKSDFFSTKMSKSPTPYLQVGPNVNVWRVEHRKISQIDFFIFAKKTIFCIQKIAFLVFWLAPATRPAYITILASPTSSWTLFWGPAFCLGPFWGPLLRVLGKRSRTHICFIPFYFVSLLQAQNERTFRNLTFSVIIF